MKSLKITFWTIFETGTFRVQVYIFTITKACLVVMYFIRGYTFWTIVNVS